MKNLIYFLFIFLFVRVAKAQYEKLTHYNIFNNVLNVMYLHDSSFLLYGSAGGVLRSSDSGSNWNQKFSGTHNDILSIHKVGNTLYGITRNGEFISSIDGGDRWDIRKISNKFFSDFYIDGDNFIIAQLTDSIMYSQDLGKTWQSKYVTSDTLVAVYSANNQIIVNINYRKLFIHKDNKWSILNLPSFYIIGTAVNIREKNNKLYFISIQYIGVLNDNMKWDEYNIGKGSIREVVETNIYLICFIYNSYSKLTEVIYYNKSKSNIDKTEVINDPRLHELSLRINFADIDKAGNIVATSSGKTIFQKKWDKTNWETINSFMIPKVDALNWLYFYDKDTWRFMTFNGNFLKTNNGGDKFEQGNYFKNDTLGQNQILIGSIDYVRYITPDSIQVNLSNSISFNKAISTDGGLNFSKYKDSSIVGNSNFYKDYGDFEIYYRNYNDKHIHKYTKLFKKYDNGDLDTLYSIDSINIISIKDYKGNLLLITEIDSNNTYHFYLTDKNFKNPKLVYSIKYDDKDSNNTLLIELNQFFVTDNQDIYLFAKRYIASNLDSYTRVYKIKDFEKKPEIVLDETPIYFYLYNFNLGDDKLVTIGLGDYKEKTIKYYFSKISIDNGFQYDLVSEIKEGNFYSVYHALNDNSMYFYNIDGNLWRPIEDDRIPTNVEDKSIIPPPIWTMAPYPNPAKNKLIIQFYSNEIVNINSLDVNVVNISTGQKILNIPYNVIVNNHWNGTIQIDTKNLVNGSYIINCKLGKISSSQKFIISK